MAYGSPESVDDLEAYLIDIRGGRPTPAALVAEIRERYLEIGGRSPLLDLTKAQAAALQAALNALPGGREIEFRTYVGMRHWQPHIHEAVKSMANDGVCQAVALVMAPHSSLMSTGAYFAHLDEALAELGEPLPCERIEHWFDHPGLIAALSKNILAGRALFPDGDPIILFTAHSLPERILSLGDPYDGQLKHTATLLAEHLGLQAGRWQFCYQSAGQSAEPWLGPPIEQVIGELARAGESQVLAAPVGFVCDHVEILYDLDIAASRLASQLGIHFERIPSLNTSPDFIQLLADLVLSRVPAQKVEH